MHTRTQLMIGSDGVDRLRDASVILCGCGAVGGYVLEGLVRGGVGRIRVVDSDVFSESNMNRQVLATTETVGRCKVEIRPLLMVEATDGQSTYNVILQNAETIKMVTPDGSKSVTVLKDGDEVLAKVSSGGRHFGMAVEETITEK